MLPNVKGLLSDVHGVLFVQPRAVPGSVGAVGRLRASGFPHLFLTNSTQFGKARILATLRAAGFPLEETELLTAAEAAGDALRELGIRRVGWLCVPELAPDLPDVEPVDPRGDAGPVEAVLVGDLGAGFTYEVMNRAFRWVHDGAPLLALARNRYYEGPDGLVLDGGPYVALLEAATGATARVLGKPAPAMFRAGLRRLGLAPAEAGMVGDDLEGDVLPAMDLGLTGILVRTGKYRETHYRAAARPAHHVAADLSEVVARVLGP